MRISPLSSLVLCSSLALAAPDSSAGRVPASFAQPLPASNPYVAKANALVSRSWNNAKAPSVNMNKVKSEAFWLTWGCTAPESEKRGDPELKADALKLTEYWTASLETKPQAYWQLIPSLQTVEFWRRSGMVAPEQVALWLKRLRPSVETCYESQNKGQWVSVAPNTLHQAAAGLQLAVSLYGAVNPKDADLKRWQKQARTCVRAAAKHQLTGGAFSYIRSSGPDPCYYNFDSTFLGIYYLLTGDSSARQSLRSMAGWSRSVTACGWVTAFASPWWKHIWGTGGPYFGPEIIAGLSRDPLTSGVMAIRRKSGQPYYFMYYAMYFYDPSVMPESIADRCEYDGNANGASLRRGEFDVEMPFRSWSESTGGASVALPKGVRSHVTSVVLTAAKDKSSAYPRSFSVVHLDDNAHRSTLCGPDWIAQAVTFRPVPGAHGNLPTEESPWRRSDLWFADADGLVGKLQLQCLRENRCNRIATWVRSSKNFTGNGLKMTSPDLEVELTGQLDDLRRVDKKQIIHEARLRGTGERIYRPGESFAVDAAIRRTDAPRLSIGPVTVVGKLHQVEIRKAGKKVALLVYNASDTTADYEPPAGTAAMWTEGRKSQTVRKERPQGNIALPACGLVLVQ
jgi:hypothetical protein